jgi:predicted helicase
VSADKTDLAQIRTFPQLVKYLRDELDWPISSDNFEDLLFDYSPEELGIDSKNAAKIQEIKRLRPLSVNQPWGVFFVKFEPKRLPVVALKRILNSVVLKKRASANQSERAAWDAEDLLFISNYGDGDARQITFAHFSQDPAKDALPTLKVLGWDNLDTPLHIDHVAEELNEHLAWPGDEEDVEGWREAWRSAFTMRHREVITTSRELAIRLAELARSIRDRIRAALAIETEAGPLTKLLKAFREALVHDLDANGFADMYAQTIAYGLLSARIADPKGGSADDLAAHMLVTNPFLKELMSTFLQVGGHRDKEAGAGLDFDELGVNEVIGLLDDANMEAIILDFGDRNPQEDPVIHFYELFLADYDKKQKVSRGVFYTPRPVVSYIVRSADQLLRTNFGLEDGLADTTTWGEMAKRRRGLEVPEGVSRDQDFVQILDPATGTGTFLVEVIDLVHRTLVAKWNKQGHGDKKVGTLWNEYVPTHLLPRLHGYELLMAPYAIAHLKVGLKLHETGYDFNSGERARIFLTNALEPPHDFSGRFDFAIPALAHEAKEVSELKRGQRYTVVVGNPPYSGHSSNTGDWISALVRDYYFVDGVALGEKNSKWLQDDYVKFLRLGQRIIDDAGCGILGVVTNHGFLDNPTFRGMRRCLETTFDAIHVLDLHGNSKKRETSPDGGQDENVFDIQQGVAISIALKHQSRIHSCVRHGDLWGTRQAKQQVLLQENVAQTPWQKVLPTAPFFIFLPRDANLEAEYRAGWSIPSIFPLNGVGMTTARDHTVIDFDEAPLLARATFFRDSKVSDSDLCRLLGIPEKKGWNIPRARTSIRGQKDLRVFVKPIMYRPFDERLIFYHDSLVWRTVKQVMRHMQAPDSLGLITTRSYEIGGGWEHAFCTRRMIQHHSVSQKEVNYLFPLLLAEDDDQPALHAIPGSRHNLSPTFLLGLAARLGIHVTSSDGLPFGITPRNVFDYLYAVLHSSSFRHRFEDFLRTDFPRVPLPGGVSLFEDLGGLGARLVNMHLLESLPQGGSMASPCGESAPAVEAVSFSDQNVWIDQAHTRGFREVPEAVWRSRIGGYQVCEKWLKDRKGRTLSQGDIDHYQRIVVALSETIRLMGAIDRVIEEHGGWPGAFAG